MTIEYKDRLMLDRTLVNEDEDVEIENIISKSNSGELLTEEEFDILLNSIAGPPKYKHNFDNYLKTKNINNLDQLCEYLNSSALEFTMKDSDISDVSEYFFRSNGFKLEKDCCLHMYNFIFFKEGYPIIKYYRGNKSTGEEVYVLSLLQFKL